MLDFGGFLKGYVSELASRILAPYQGSIINIGGDITTRGMDEDGNPFLFFIAHPFKKNEIIGQMVVENTSIATSSPLKRAWGDEYAEFHHIMDPRTHDSARNNIASITVIAPSGSQADAYATVGDILGIDEGLRFFTSKNIPALFIDLDGKLHMTPAMNDNINRVSE
jgi:thiamine biosynthesis lipoprotein